jgi:hypothetical protein
MEANYQSAGPAHAAVGCREPQPIIRARRYCDPLFSDGALSSCRLLWPRIAGEKRRVQKGQAASTITIRQ